MILGMLIATAASVATLVAPAADPSNADASPLHPWYRDDALIVRLTPHATETLRRTASRERGGSTLGLPGFTAATSRLGGVRFEREFPGHPLAVRPGGADLSSFLIAHLPPGLGVQTALRTLGAMEDVQSAHRIAVTRVTAIPDDSLWSAAYYFHQPSRRDLHAPEAWDITTGDTRIVVAIIDTGVLLDHPDLRNQFYRNPAERDGLAGVDDDGNGYIDDVTGWDFVWLPNGSLARAGEDWLNADNDPNDYAGHGTAVAGVVGARTDNRIGVAGTAWDVRLMPLRIGWSSDRAPTGEVDMSFAAQAIAYAARNGATIINCSFEAVGQPDLAAAIDAAIHAGVTIVTPAGNNGSARFLAERPSVVSVAATDREDQVPPFSNRGDYVDLAAPGINIATTSLQRTGEDSLASRQPDYTQYAGGTSFSSPLAAGAAALYQAERLERGQPLASPMQVLLRLVETTDDIDDRNEDPWGYGSGRLNMHRVLTDPPGSVVADAKTQTVGAGVAVELLSGGARHLYATGAGHLLILDDRGAVLDSVALSARPVGGLAAADMGNGQGLGVFVATADGKIHGLEADGRARIGWPVTTAVLPEEELFEPALGDLDGDGALEVVWGGSDGNVWAWRADGTPFPAFPRVAGGAGRNLHVALTDLNGADGAEIITVSENGLLRAFHHTGLSLPSWEKHVPIGAYPPAVTRHPEGGTIVLIAAGTALSGFATDVRFSWGRRLEGFVITAPALGDLDGDGEDEMVFSMSPPLLTRVVDLDGSDWARPGWPRPAPRVFGTTLIAPVGGGDGPAIVMFDVKTGLVAWDRNGDPLGRFPKPGIAGSFASAGDFDGDGRTELLAGSGIAGAVFSYDAGLESWNAAHAHWPTARGNFARTGSRLYTPAMTAWDDVPPDAVTDVSVEAMTTRSIELRWRAPAEVGDRDRAEAYDLRYAEAPLGGGNFDVGTRVEGMPAPGTAGAEERVTVTGLAEDRRYYFLLRARDRAGNWSSFSNAVEARTGRLAPAVVNDLRVAATSVREVVLAWTGVGDDGAAGRPQLYQLRVAETQVDDANFDKAPIGLDLEPAGQAGSTESRVLTGLESGRRYWAALKAVDAAGNRSPLSNVIEVWVGPLGAQEGIALAPEAQPSRLPVRLHWQRATVSAGHAATLRIYDVAGRLQRVHTVGDARRGVWQWDGRDAAGRAVPAGLYLGSFSAGGQRTSTRIVLIR